MKCLRCGEELPDGLNFCPFCGADLTAARAREDDPKDEPNVAEHVCVDREVPAEAPDGQADNAAFEEPSAFNPYSNFTGGGNGFTNVRADAAAREKREVYGARFSSALKEEKEKTREQHAVVFAAEADAAGGPGAQERTKDEEPGFDPYSHNRRKAGQAFTGCPASGSAQVTAPNGPTISVMVPASEAALPPEYRPISMWGYFGYSLLFSIPFVGFILAIVYSFGGTQNINLRNFSRSYFCLFLLGVAVAVLLVIIAAVTGFFYRY